MDHQGIAMGNDTEQKAQAAQTIMHAWMSRLSDKDKKTVQQAPSDEFEAVVRAIIERRLNEAQRNKDDVRALAREQQQAYQLLAQLEDPDQLMNQVKTFPAKQAIAAKTEEDHQKQTNIFLRGLEVVKKQTGQLLDNMKQQTLALADKLIPSPLQKLFDPQKQQQTQQQQQKETTPAEKVTANRQQEQKVDDKARNERIAKARAARSEQIAKTEQQKRRGGRGGRGGGKKGGVVDAVMDTMGQVTDALLGRETVETENTLQPVTPAIEAEHYAAMTQSVLDNARKVASNVSATLMPIDPNNIAAPSTPIARNNQQQGMNKNNIPGGGGSMTA